MLKFLFEFYNYASFVKNDTSLDDKERDITALLRSVVNKYPRSLYSTSAKQRKTNPGPPEGGEGGAGSGSNRRSEKRKHDALTDALLESRYEVFKYSHGYEPPVTVSVGRIIVMKWANSWAQLPAHVVEARDRNGRIVIAKLTCKNSSEESFLHELKLHNSLHNHVIPLLGTIQSTFGPVIVLPRATSLSIIEYKSSSADAFRGKFVSLSCQLVEGVAFLHRQKIAHLDIKPDNLVFDFHLERLYIIDFDNAMQCKDEDEMVEMSCGTRGWSAPEIVMDTDKTLRPFSPIRADLWSCGKVLERFSEVLEETDEDIGRLTSLLIDEEPKRRPLLHEIVDEEPNFWSCGRISQAITHIRDRQMQETITDGGIGLKRMRDETGSKGKELEDRPVYKVGSLSSPLSVLHTTPSFISFVSVH